MSSLVRFRGYLGGKRIWKIRMIEMMDMEGGILKLLDRGIKYILEFNESIFVFRRGVKMSKKHLVVYYFEGKEFLWIFDVSIEQRGRCYVRILVFYVLRNVDFFFLILNIWSISYFDKYFCTKKERKLMIEFLFLSCNFLESRPRILSWINYAREITPNLFNISLKF